MFSPKRKLRIAGAWSYVCRRRAGFAPLVLGWIISWASLLGLDTVMQFFGFSGWVSKVSNFLHNPSLWLFPFLIFASVVIFIVMHWWESQSLRDDFEKEWDDLDSDRDALRDGLDDAFDNWRRTDDSSHIKELLRKAGFPDDVLNVESSLVDYAEKAVGGWGGPKGELLNLCLTLCPPRKGPFILNQEEQQRFRVARKKLSKFWEKWGRKCLERNEISFDDVAPRMIVGETPYVVLLVYLEIAHARRTEEWAPGKQRLFKMAKAFSEKSNLM